MVQTTGNPSWHEIGGATVAAMRYASFDGGVRLDTCCIRPERYRVWSALRPAPAIISRGAGLSYVPASFAAGGLSVEHARFNRVLALDVDARIVEVEAGITLGGLFRVLAAHGLYLATQPGHPAITVGGCIAADVHGKNQLRDGTFMEQVEALRLFHPRHGTMEVTRENDPQLFRLTCGGYGLTGSILSARLRVRPIPASLFIARSHRIADGITIAPALRAAAQLADVVYTWQNFTARHGRFGQGWLYEARFAEDTDQPDGGHIPPYLRRFADPPLSAATRGRGHPPWFNRFTVRGFNALYGTLQGLVSGERRVGLFEAIFPVSNKQVYFHLFGRRGFHECQMLVPEAQFADFATAIQARLRRNPLPITLASAKAFGGARELLRFRGDGLCLALNFPRSAAATAFMEFLDELLAHVGGIPNLIKDSRLPQSVVARCYPEYERFRALLRDYDPARAYRSEFSQRLGL